MRIEFLGTGGFFANERRHTACLMIPEVGVVLDAGSGMFRSIDRIQTDTIDIFLSHAHLDHVIGLPCVLIPLMKGQLKSARVFANASTLQAVKDHLFAEPLFPILPDCEFNELVGAMPVRRQRHDPPYRARASGRIRRLSHRLARKVVGLHH